MEARRTRLRYVFPPLGLAVAFICARAAAALAFRRHREPPREPLGDSEAAESALHEKMLGADESP